MSCPYHPEGDCPMQRLADHAVEITPRGLNVIVFVVEPQSSPDQPSHAALATRTRPGFDVPDLLRHFANDLDHRYAARAVAQAVRHPGTLRIEEGTSLAELRTVLTKAVVEGLNTIVMSPERLLHLLNQGLS